MCAQFHGTGTKTLEVNIPEQLTLTVSLRGNREVRDGYQLFRLTGQLDAFSEPAFRRVMVRCIEEGPAHLILDLSTIDFMDSSGLGALVQIAKKIQGHQGSLRIVTNPRVTQTVKLVRLEQFLSLVGSLEEAQTSLLAAPSAPPSAPPSALSIEAPEASGASTPPAAAATPGLGSVGILVEPLAVTEGAAAGTVPSLEEGMPATPAVPLAETGTETGTAEATEAMAVSLAPSLAAPEPVEPSANENPVPPKRSRTKPRESAPALSAEKALPKPAPRSRAKAKPKTETTISAEDDTLEDGTLDHLRDHLADHLETEPEAPSEKKPEKKLTEPRRSRGKKAAANPPA